MIQLACFQTENGFFRKTWRSSPSLFPLSPSSASTAKAHHPTVECDIGRIAVFVCHQILLPLKVAHCDVVEHRPGKLSKPQSQLKTAIATIARIDPATKCNFLLQCFTDAHGLLPEIRYFARGRQSKKQRGRRLGAVPIGQARSHRDCCSARGWAHEINRNRRPGSSAGGSGRRSQIEVATPTGV